MPDNARAKSNWVKENQKNLYPLNQTQNQYHKKSIPKIIRILDIHDIFELISQEINGGLTTLYMMNILARASSYCRYAVVELESSSSLDMEFGIRCYPSSQHYQDDKEKTGLKIKRWKKYP